MTAMRNVHTRLFSASIEQIRPWMEAAWSATDRDMFPRDVIPDWRRNPPGADPLALLPGVTRVGHGPFSFRLVAWDGARWRVEVETAHYPGWHGFDLRPVDDGCEVTHTLEIDLQGLGRFVWPALMASIHDWAVEAAFDRLAHALATGSIPIRTERPMPWHARAPYELLRTARARRLRRILRTVTT